MLRVDEWTGTCCCPTGLIKPTFSYRFCNPERRAREQDVLPTCCFVAATKTVLGFFLFSDGDDDDDVDDEDDENDDDSCRMRQVVGVVMSLLTSCTTL